MTLTSPGFSPPAWKGLERAIKWQREEEQKERGSKEMYKCWGYKIKLGEGQRPTGLSKNIRLITAEWKGPRRVCPPTNNKITAPQGLAEVRGKSKEDKNGGTGQASRSFSPPNWSKLNHSSINQEPAKGKERSASNENRSKERGFTAMI